MPRISTVKPELFMSMSLARVSRDARLLFIGLLTQADPYGKLPDAPKMLAGTVFPHDEDATAARVDEWLAELDKVGCIERYTVDGERAGSYISLPGWEDHQKIAHRGRPRFPDKDGRLLEPSGREREVSGARLEPGIARKERKGKENISRERLEADFAEAWEHYPRKLARRTALNAYLATRRRGVEAADLLAATRRYANLRRGEDPKFTLYGSTFYGPNERWRVYLADAPAVRERSDPNDGPSWGNLSRPM